MRLTQLEIAGFKSFAKKATLTFTAPVTSVVGPNGSGKSNVVEAFRFVLGEQSMKSMRGKSGADLIFRGGTGAPKLSRAAVSITFDNTDNVFGFQTGEGTSPVLFDTVTFMRELFADGTSTYSMNGSEIKLKQMVELLASVNIGTQAHHIISQGEADGILRANARDRREMLEDALGLRVYHFRIKESETKLGRALDTLKEVQLVRRELAPHLKFLQKQVEKIEKGRAIRDELQALLLQYLATERALLGAQESVLRDSATLFTDQKHTLEATLAALPSSTAQAEESDMTAINTHRAHSVLLQEKRRNIEQKMYRLEGMVEAERRRALVVHEQRAPEAAISFVHAEYMQLLEDLASLMQELREAASLDEVRRALEKLAGLISELRAREPKKHHAAAAYISDDTLLRDAALDLEGLETELRAVVADEEKARGALEQAEKMREAVLSGARAATESRYRLVSEIKQCEAELHIIGAAQHAYTERKAHFDTELAEAGFMFGPAFVRELQHAVAVPEFDLYTQKRDIDRLKIRLDEHSGIGTDVLTEYESAKERDVFLAREVTDTEASIRNLESLIIELKKVLDERFTKGVQTINERFGEFFKTMFGGGSAFLSITNERKRRKKADDESEGIEEHDERFFERGIDVHVSLPEKKVKDLQMLSGGERSLVSIALLFAISQVNPPPFLVLDETDAALDEANARRYGDMVERLSEYSQLIVVTHNRETMSRASVLYGVTLGADGGSKLLSIKFDDAVKVAK